MTKGIARQGQEYRHGDGTREVVFAKVGGRVLTVKEYPTINRFFTAIESAEACGINEEVANLPPVTAFKTKNDID